MSGQYDEESAKQMSTQKQSWMDYAKENKVTIIIILIIAAIAIWYFYFRKESSSSSMLPSLGESPSKVNIIRMRVSGAY